jgi:glycosyltransferase involved in cell wall biosynthesis
MSTLPTVSVIIPAFNAAATIGVALRSALAQSYRPLEIIVVDDGSSDATAGIVSGFRPAVRLRHQPNSGCGPARNTGAKAAEGDWLAFLDADDAWLPRKLERQVPFTQDSSVGVVNTRARARSGRPLGTCFSFEELWRQNDLIVSSSLVRRTAFECVGGFWAERYCEDYHMWLRLAAAGWAVANCPEDLVVYSPAPGSLSQQVELFAAAEIACVRDVARAVGLPDEVLNRRVIACYLKHAAGAIHNRNLRLARRMMRKSLAVGVGVDQLLMLTLANLPVRLLDWRRKLFAGGPGGGRVA